MAPKPMAPIPKSLAGGSLITEIIVNKYQYHLPLYRQSKMLASYNVLIPDNTLGNLVMLSGEGLMPIYEACWKTITSSDYLQADETPVKILKPDKKGYLWTYYAPLVEKGLVVYELALSREGKVAQQRLANFKGLLQTDGYSGYNELRDREDITGFSCMSHGHRKFDAVLKITKNKRVRIKVS
jgi:transposase